MTKRGYAYRSARGRRGDRRGYRPSKRSDSEAKLAQLMAIRNAVRPNDDPFAPESANSRPWLVKRRPPRPIHRVRTRPPPTVRTLDRPQPPAAPPPPHVRNDPARQALGRQGGGRAYRRPKGSDGKGSPEEEDSDFEAKLAQIRAISNALRADGDPFAPASGEDAEFPAAEGVEAEELSETLSEFGEEAGRGFVVGIRPWLAVRRPPGQHPKSRPPPAPSPPHVRNDPARRLTAVPWPTESPSRFTAASMVPSRRTATITSSAGKRFLLLSPSAFQGENKSSHYPLHLGNSESLEAWGRCGGVGARMPGAWFAIAPRRPGPGT